MRVASSLLVLLAFALPGLTAAHAGGDALGPVLLAVPECSRPGPLALDAPAPPEIESEVTRSVLDAASGAGTDVEMLRSASGTILLAHKRHTGEATATSVPVELVVLRSEDGGSTWTERVVDAHLRESRTVARDVSFAAASDGRLYLSYASNDGSDASAVLHVARSEDDGRTWARVSSLARGTGAYAAIGEVQPGHLMLAVTHVLTGGRFSANVPAVAESQDGGATWSMRELATPIEHGAADVALGVDGVGGAVASWYNPAAGTPSSQKLIAAARGDAGWSWSTVAKGCVRAGIGLDTISSGAGLFRTAYFNWTNPSRIDLATSGDGGRTWSNAVVDASHLRRSATGSWLGEPLWPTALDGWDASRLVVAYGWVTRDSADPLFQTARIDRTLARLAVSDDGGATWRHKTLDLDGERGRHHDVLALPDGDALVAMQEGLEAEAKLVLLRVPLT